MKIKCDPDVIRTRSLLIWSQTRYHCATEPGRFVQFTLLDLNCSVVQSDSVRNGAMDQTFHLKISNYKNGTSF